MNITVWFGLGMFSTQEATVSLGKAARLIKGAVLLKRNQNEEDIVMFYCQNSKKG